MRNAPLFAAILVAGCNHSSSSSAPVAPATVDIPAATTTSPPTASDALLPPSRVDAACNVPSDWPVGEALAAADETAVLAWRQRVDERPLYVDDALVWQKRTVSGKPMWTLAHVYRHPKDENRFRLSVVFDAPVSPEENYDHAPNGKDVEAFLKHASWSWDPETFKMTAGSVCTATWTHLIGEAPKHEFTK
ncbi:MAG: hypothetical protein ABI551_03725 [Polyangiaceae bacterium]